MVSSRLKKAFEGWISSKVGVLHSIGLTPNAVTVLGLIASIAAALFYLSWNNSILNLLGAACLILLSGFLDAVDGVIARAAGKTSRFGGFLDSVSDRYSDAIVLSAVVIADLCNPLWGLLAIVGSLMVSYARARAEAAGVGMEAVGVAERAERMIILAAVTFLAYVWLDALSWGVIIIAILSHLTVLQRAYHFYKEAEKT